MIRAALISLGLVLYPATQLRFGELPVGPGELCLIGWIGWTGMHRLLREQIRWNAALSHLLAFWLVLGLAQCVGMIVGLVVEPYQDTAAVVHDIWAYALLITVGFLLALELAEDARRRRTVSLVVYFGALVLTVQVVDGFGLIGVARTDPWFFDRFRGWSLDPNQLGLLAAALSLLSLHLLDTKLRVGGRIAVAICGTIAFSVGLLTKSDSYVICIMVAGGVLFGRKAWTALSQVGNRRTLAHALFVSALLSLPLAAIAAVPFAQSAIGYLELQSNAVYEEDGQGDTRLALWTEAFEKGLQSGFLGFGPGPHLTSKSYKRPPPDKFESHNTTLDLFTQGGLAAVLIFVWLCASTVVRSWRAKLPALIGLAVGLTAFSMFHLVIRHPMFWFGIVLCLLESARATQSVPAGPRLRLVQRHST
ncbi:O-antigen ligase family protein [Mesorhizobium sp.]|uniref:O-antigen ligase family protein n=1 Tax=Mesorhizobium sp. TaxID=1871066 RepID=UPI000FE4F984|nr:O-antigen ligase family protein [Mesorhizobium sp.]RWP23104.1 MAG: O-antigen ligase domain-containing protein [Mesorhizobium sp.]